MLLRIVGMTDEVQLTTEGRIKRMESIFQKLLYGAMFKNSSRKFKQLLKKHSKFAQRIASAASLSAKFPKPS